MTDLSWDGGAGGIEKVKNGSQVSGKKNWIDVTKIGNSRREDLKEGIKRAVSDVISLMSVRFP